MDEDVQGGRDAIALLGVMHRNIVGQTSHAQTAADFNAIIAGATRGHLLSVLGFIAGVAVGAMDENGDFETKLQDMALRLAADG
jgi:hypothetical protein